jgi:2-oxoglutarate ferredoxin oxidoreductase subunit delta
MPAIGTILVDENRCKGCDLCVMACPKDVLSLAMDRLNPKGYHPAKLHTEGCTGCALCAVVCPDACITVYRTISSARAKAA